MALKRINTRLAFRLLYLIVSLLGLNVYAYTTPDLPQKRSLKILVVADFFPLKNYIVIVNHIYGLLSRGHDVRVYAKRGRDNLMPSSLVSYNMQNRIYRKFPSDIDSYDIILCEFGFIGKNIVEMTKNRNMKAKIVTCFRGYDTSSKIRSNKNIYQNLFKHGDLFLPVCDYFRERLISLGAPATKTIVHYSSIDCSKFKFTKLSLSANGTVNIITVARLVGKKGINDALHAIKLVVQRFPNIQYTIVGEGPLKSKLQTLTEQLGLTNHVVFTGWQDPDQIAQHLAKAHIFILPCVIAKNFDEDGIPNSAKEAMACGLPVVSTYVAGIPELIQDEITGFLVKEHDREALAQKIEFLIKHPEMWEQLGKNGRSLIEEKFDINKQSDELESLLLKCANEQ